MKLITSKYKISKDIFENNGYDKISLIKFTKEKLFRMIGTILEDLVDSDCKFDSCREIMFETGFYNFETGFYIASTKEFDELKHLIRKNEYNISQEDYLKFKNILENYEK